MKETISIVLVIIGALVGAGFASGQEIYSFFYLYGKNGIYGILIMSVLIGILIYKSLKIIFKNEIYNYEDFLGLFIGNKKIKKMICIIINLLLLISFFIMIAGFGAYFEQEIGVDKLIGSIILDILCAIVFFSDVKGVLKVSDLIVPFLILFIFFIGFQNIIEIQNIEFIMEKNNWILSSLIYNSYNFILLIPVLISLKKQIKTEKNIKYISILTSVIITILSIIIYFLLARVNIIEIENQEMPVVYVISKYFFRYKKIYAFIILASIFTTAISVGIGFIQNISTKQRSYPHIVLFMCITSLIVSNIGFSKLVNLIYPLFGCIGILQMIIIFFIK